MGRLHCGIGLLTTLSVLLILSCGEKREVVEVVEEEGQKGSPISGGSAPQKRGGKQPGSKLSQGAAEVDPLTGATDEGGSSVDSGGASGGPVSSSSPSSTSSPSTDSGTTSAPVPDVVAWEPLAVSALVTTYCAGACHGVHGQFASKDYFISLKAKHLEQLRLGKMPPPKLFANFRGNADEAALIKWLEQQ